MKLHIAIVALLFAESSYIHAEESFVPTVTPTEKFTWDASENESTETFPPTTFLPTSFLPITFLPTGDYVDPDAKCIVDPDGNGILVIPMSWTKIGKKAFYRCEKIKSVEIPAKVQFLKDNAFSGTNNLEKITFEGGSQLEEISNEAFYGSKLQSKIILPKSVLVIGNGAFRGTSIETFTFEENSELASIGDYVSYFSITCLLIWLSSHEKKFIPFHFVIIRLSGVLNLKELVYRRVCQELEEALSYIAIS